jgi:hypothetical protein
MGATEMLDRRAPKIARAREMRREGKRHREIARSLGICAAAIGPFFSNTNEMREFPASREYPIAA